MDNQVAKLPRTKKSTLGYLRQSKVLTTFSSTPKFGILGINSPGRNLLVSINRRLRGVNTGCSPVIGKSASSRLRFRSMRVARSARVGEAKMRGRMTIVVLIAGPPRCFRVRPGGFSLSFCCYALGF